MSDAMTPLRDIPEVREAIVKLSEPVCGNSHRRCVHGCYSELLGGDRNFTGAGCVRSGWSGQRRICAVRHEHRHMCHVVIASVGANRNAKRVAIVHLLFNVIGTAVFAILCELTPVIDWVASWTPGKAVAQIANMHTLFNVTMTVLLFPFTNQLARLSQMILPVKVTRRKARNASCALLQMRITA